MGTPDSEKAAYKTYVRPLGECVRRPDWRPRGSVELKFLEKELWPAFDALPTDVQDLRPVIQFAIAQLKAFFAAERTAEGCLVDEKAAEIYVWFLQSKLL